MIPLMGVFSNPNLLFNFLLKLSVINLAHFTCNASSSWIIVITIAAHCTLWALDKLMSWLASKVGFARQNWAFVLKWGLFFKPCSLCLSDILVVPKTCHHCVQVELLRLCASKSWRLLPMEKNSSLLPCCLFSLSVYKGTLVLITDVLFNELLFFIILIIVNLSITLHHPVHCGELPIVYRRFALIVPQATETIRSLVISYVICPSLEIITSSKLLVIPSILIDKLLHLIVLRVECVHETVLIGCCIILTTILRVMIVSWDIPLGYGSCGRISIFFFLVVTDEIVVRKA